MSKTTFFIILSTVALLAAISCKKKNQSSPVVTLNAPANGSTFTVGDTIPVSGTITDNIPIENIGITLLNDQYQPASVGTSFSEGGKTTISFNDTYVVNDLQLASGTYYISLSAYDGENTANDTKRIYLNAAPQVRTGIYLVTASNNSSTHVAIVDSAHNAQRILTLSGDYSSAAISALYQQVYVCGKYSGSLNAINLSSQSVAWSIPATGTSAPFFEYISYSNAVIYTCYYSGNIIGYNNVQSTVLNASAALAFYPITILNNNGSLFVEQHEVNGNSEILMEYNSSGASLQNTPLNAKLVQMFTIDQNDVILFGNSSSHGIIESYNSQSNVIQTLAVCDSMNDAVELYSGNYALALTTGIYEYNYSNNILSPFIPASNASSIAYDNVNNQLFAAVGSTLYVYNASGSGLLYSVNASEPIKKVLLLFNR